MIDAVILAGGKSSRMKQDKALMPFANSSSMAKYQYDRLLPHFNRVYISAKENKFDFEAPIIYDKYKEYSPLIAIKSIIEELNKPFFLIAVDMPLVSIEDIKKLIKIYEKNVNYDAYLFKSKNGYEPTITIYNPRILKYINSMLKNGNHKLQNLLSKIKLYSVECNKSKSFVNINTTKDYELFNK